MDPDEALAHARAHAKTADALDDENKDDVIGELANALGYYQALDDWITKGGFLPNAWAKTVGALPSI